MSALKSEALDDGSGGHEFKDEEEELASKLGKISIREFSREIKLDSDVLNDIFAVELPKGANRAEIIKRVREFRKKTAPNYRQDFSDVGVLALAKLVPAAVALNTGAFRMNRKTVPDRARRLARFFAGYDDPEIVTAEQGLTNKVLSVQVVTYERTSFVHQIQQSVKSEAMAEGIRLAYRYAVSIDPPLLKLALNVDKLAQKLASKPDPVRYDWRGPGWSQEFWFAVYKVPSDYGENLE